MQTDQQRFGPDPEASIRANLAMIRARIDAACRRAERDPAGVRLLPVSKTVPARILRLAHAAGLSEFGENKVQEAETKAAELADLPIRWSIVGHLQTNKAKHVARFAGEFQALDNLRVAEALHSRLQVEGRTLDVFVQVNTSGEASKFGLAVADVAAFVTRLAEFPALQPRGFMTLAEWSDDAERVRAYFRRLRELRDAIAHPSLTGLSMGMSGDFEIAIEEGASVVRIGTALFGQRSGANDS
jgi:pyridoxal phosphate enzyme (YggS family)